MRQLAEVQNDIIEARSTNADWESVVKPLYDEQSAIIKHDRDVYEDENYFVRVDCPVHLTHKVKLFTYEHRYAGIWECDESGEGISDSCPHFDTRIEVGEDFSGSTFRYYACALCGVALDGDPDEESYDETE